MITLYTQGTYDLFHWGHVCFLRRCSELADHVIVALLSDEAIKKYRGHEPVIDFNGRKQVLLSCKYVDKVIESDNMNTINEIAKYDPDIVAIGSDWAKKDIYKQYNAYDNKKWLNTKLIFIPYTEGISCTQIKEKIWKRKS